MYAVVKSWRGPGAEIRSVETPKVGKKDVLVKVKALSICGTDVHIWNWDSWARKRVKKIPLIFGHEFAGEVVEKGEDVTTVDIGDMVSAETHIVDGTCYQCRTDRMHICRNMKILGVDTDGVFAEYVLVPEMNIWKNDPKIDPYLMALQEPLGNAVQTVLPKDHVEDIAGKNIAVLGCGPTGLMAIAVLREIGAAKIFATTGGHNKVRMELAKKMGADLVLSVAEEGENIVKIILDETDGNGVDVVLEMSGSPLALRQAFEILTPGGRVSLLGIYREHVTLDVTNAIVFKAATVYGITGRRMFQTWYQVRGLLSRPNFREKISSIITHKVPVRDIAKGMDLLNNKKAAKVALEPKW
ncbi:L-threonine 3-dehydrogenase [Candidatus Bathyarchaeota archaeon]|nr:MAG: L-threonine 3-dehydrogenase [Candidatus Bathyarchaeota archaeon]